MNHLRKVASPATANPCSMEVSPPADSNWSNLPADVLTTVLGLLEFPDLFSSAVVCTTWRHTAHALRRLGLYNRPQTPCLLYTTAAGGPRAAELFSLADKNTYKTRLPDPPICERDIVGSSHGCLVTADARSELHLVNPATGEQVAFPSVATVEQVNPVLDHAGRLQRYELSFYDANLPREEHDEPQPYQVDELRDVLYLKVVLSGDPSRGGCIAMMIHNPYRQLSFARVGSNMWNWVTTSFLDSEYSDCIFHDGAFYAMNRLGGIHRYTIEGSCARRDIILKDTAPYVAHSVYISRTPSGDVLQIWRLKSYTQCEPEELRTTGIEIYKVNFDKQSIEGLNTLGDDALFIGHNHKFCISTKDYPRLLPNHVLYFTDDAEYWLIDGRHSRRDVGIFSLEDKLVSELVSPQRWLNWPVPLWITPCFTKIHK